MKNQTSTRSALHRDNAEAGKHRSSLTAFRHGVTGQVIVMPTDIVEVYQSFTKGFFDELKPVNPVEKQLVQSLADTSWRLNRCTTMENNLFAPGYVDDSDAPPPVIAKLLREKIRLLAAISAHGERLSRQLDATLKLFRKLQSQRRQRQENEDLTTDGFVFSNSDEQVR